MLFVDSLILVDYILELVGAEFVIILDLGLLLGGVENVLEILMVAAHNNIAEHVDKSAINVVSEPGIVGSLDDPSDNVVVKAQIQDGIHHSGHRNGCTASDTDQQWMLRVA